MRSITPCLVIGVLIGLGISSTHGYSRGAPSISCYDLTPQHGSPPQSSNPPFSLTVEKNGDNTVTVTLGGGGTKFKGLIIQARLSKDTSEILKGKFSTTSGVKTMNCGGGSKNTLTHSSNTRKTTVTTVWTPPSDFNGDVIFR
ncbi:putative defense protein Hdd11 isoform X2 [Limulus polyphemus]|nr:putative defense protein Hdd11 isoform X2 [Limulus polyphemus]